MRTTSMTSGSEPSGNVAVASPVSTSSRGLRAAVLDVVGELRVEELERVVRHAPASVLPTRLARAASAASSARNISWSASGTPSRSAIDEHRERARELADELALAVGDELVELAIGEPPHELLVLA